jgi:rhodanese-related sulfurtransferase
MSFLSKLMGRSGSDILAPADFIAQRAPDAPVLDVRTPEEYAAGRLDGAINVDVMAPDFQERIDALAAEDTLVDEQPIYLYCRTGSRSGKAADILRAWGFAEAHNVGAYEALKAAGAAVEE